MSPTSCQTAPPRERIAIIAQSTHAGQRTLQLDLPSPPRPLPNLQTRSRGNNPKHPHDRQSGDKRPHQRVDETQEYRDETRDRVRKILRSRAEACCASAEPASSRAVPAWQGVSGYACCCRSRPSRSSPSIFAAISCSRAPHASCPTGHDQPQPVHAVFMRIAHRLAQLCHEVHTEPADRSRFDRRTERSRS